MNIVRHLVFLSIGSLAVLVSLAAFNAAPSLFERIDMKLKDSRLIWRGPRTPDARVVIAALDPKSIKEVGRWPWPRTDVAELISNLQWYGAKVIGLDMIFSEPDNSCNGAENDLILGKSIFNAGNVVAGYFFRADHLAVDDAAFAHIASTRLEAKISQDVKSVPLFSFNGIDLNIAAVAGQGALDHGFFTVMPEQDGLYRRAVLLALFNGDIFASLSLKCLSYFIEQPIDLQITTGGVSSFTLGSTRIPVDTAGRMPLNYYGPAGSFRTVSAVDVIKKRLPADALKGTLVFVGATETGIFDLRPTPFDPVLPGVEIHATLASNVLQNNFIRHNDETRRLERWAIIIIPVVLGLLLSLAPGSLTGLLIYIAGGGVYIVANYRAFVMYHHDMTIIYPLLGISLTYLGGEAYRSLVVDRKGRQLKKAFSSYVSPDLVKQIEKNPDRLILGGEQRELSILFSDIRGFTTFSESLSPQELVVLLNEYLTPMTRIVLEERGTLDKFIGDAVMALFNAPLTVPDHATRACAAAVKMMEELEVLNVGFVARGMQTIDIGIGINTGPAVVGNMGADIRFDYTAIGDSVNLASRLEGLNKQYGSNILVSEETRKQVQDPRFVFREVDRVRVKGKNLPIVMYELMLHHAEMLPRFEEALKMYRRQEFAAAKTVFDDLADRYDDGPSHLYSLRCDEYLAEPPGEGWDGVFISRSK
jgi:adenylate cyclase